MSGETNRLFDRANKEVKPAYCVFNETTKSFLGLNVKRVDTVWACLKNLLRTASLSSDEGVWVERSCGIYIAGALTPIDMVYLDVNSRVVRVAEHVAPFRSIKVSWWASSVLELAPHTIYASNTKVGDQILICLPEEIEPRLKKSRSRLDSPVSNRKAASS